MRHAANDRGEWSSDRLCRDDGLRLHLVFDAWLLHDHGKGDHHGPIQHGDPGPNFGDVDLAEITGSVTRTWTDYEDAGGTEGPFIASNQTVQITCRVTGFTVADGNTWWYEIASSPWNNNYYASADAFYNNGETSGLWGASTGFRHRAVPGSRNGHALAMSKQAISSDSA